MDILALGIGYAVLTVALAVGVIELAMLCGNKLVNRLGLASDFLKVARLYYIDKNKEKESDND